MHTQPLVICVCCVTHMHKVVAAQVAAVAATYDVDDDDNAPIAQRGEK